MRAAALAAAALLAGCAGEAARVEQVEARGAREFAAATRGRTAGEPSRCINPQQTGGPQIVAPDRLVYRDAGTVWVTRAEGCPFLDDNAIVVAEIFGGQLCRNDRFRTIQRSSSAAIPGPFCRYGDFTPYRRVR